MKALTLRAPWPFAIAYLNKRTENRDWDPRTAELMGLPWILKAGEPIAIHGGTPPKRGKNKGWREFEAGFEAMVEMAGGMLTPEAEAYLKGVMDSGPMQLEHFILPGIVAVVTVTHATRGTPLDDPWAIPGQLHLLLNPVFTLPTPVQCAGSQGFWTVDEETEYQVERQIARIPVPKTGVTLQDWYA
ncbi:hypothetical protein Q0M94_03555 [Deinococcus radiomollis]|uniref:hypothetical protein n=1 Tax=Deinococcus radiomollis TaxID=468916 RepID=UPI003891ECE3